MRNFLLLAVAILMFAGCTKVVEDKSDTKPPPPLQVYEDTVQVDSSYTFDYNNTGISFYTVQMRADDYRPFGVTTSSGAFDFTTCNVQAECLQLLDMTVINYDAKPMYLIVHLEGEGGN